MKTDALFYEIFKEFPNIFFEIIGKADTNTNIYEFIAPEIKQKSFRLDGVFFPDFSRYVEKSAKNLTP
jgi:predicted transposase YdaD